MHTENFWLIFYIFYFERVTGQHLAACINKEVVLGVREIGGEHLFNEITNFHIRLDGVFEDRTLFLNSFDKDAHSIGTHSFEVDQMENISIFNFYFLSLIRYEMPIQK